MDDLFFCFLENEHLGKEVVITHSEGVLAGKIRELTYKSIRIYLPTNENVVLETKNVITIKKVSKITRPPTGYGTRSQEMQ